MRSRSLEVPEPACQEHRADTDGAGHWLGHGSGAHIAARVKLTRSTVAGSASLQQFYPWASVWN
jgi:hypothetical protein